MAEWANDKSKWRTLKFDGVRVEPTVRVKVIKALHYKAGKDRLLTIVLVPGHAGQATRSNVLLHTSGLGRSSDSRLLLGGGPVKITFQDYEPITGL